MMEVPSWPLAAVVGALAGLLSGSLVAVLVTQAQRARVLTLPGRCPHCAARLRLTDLVPLAQRHCRACGTDHGSWQRALELTTAALFAVMGARFSLSPLLPAVWYLTALAVALAAIDIRHHRLPDRLILPSYPLALLLLGAAALALPGSGGHLVRALAGMAAGAGFYLLLALIQPAGIGWGDVKLSGLLGLYLGWFGVTALVTGVAGAFLLAALTGLGLLAAGRATRKTHLPLGPFMLAATLAVIVAAGAWPPLASLATS